MLGSWTGGRVNVEGRDPSRSCDSTRKIVKAAPACSCLTLPTSRQLAGQLGIASDELCTPDKLPSLVEAVRAIPDPRAPHLVTHPLPILLGLVACALLCGVSSVCGVIRWAHGQGAGILTPLEVSDGNFGQLPVATTLTRTVARLDADALDATGRHVRADPHGRPASRDRGHPARAPARRGRQDRARRPRRRRSAAAPARRLPGRSRLDARPARDAPRTARDPALHRRPGPDPRHQQRDRHRRRPAHRRRPLPLPAPTRRVRALPRQGEPLRALRPARRTHPACDARPFCRAGDAGRQRATITRPAARRAPVTSDGCAAEERSR
ncbi:transposase family protein [Streptomyces sp. NPDC001340]